MGKGHYRVGRLRSHAGGNRGVVRFPCMADRAVLVLVLVNNMQQCKVHKKASAESV